MVRQKFNAPVGTVAGNDVHVHHYWPESQPPDDPEMSIQCWQCGRLTWRYSGRCIHCAVRLRSKALVQLAVRLSAWLDRRFA